MTGITWFKSTHSAANGACVEVAEDDDQVWMRDSKLGERSPVLSFTRDAFAAFVRAIQDGDHDLPGEVTA